MPALFFSTYESKQLYFLVFDVFLFGLLQSKQHNSIAAFDKTTSKLQHEMPNTRAEMSVP